MGKRNRKGKSQGQQKKRDLKEESKIIVPEKEEELRDEEANCLLKVLTEVSEFDQADLIVENSSDWPFQDQSSLWRDLCIGAYPEKRMWLGRNLFCLESPTYRNLARQRRPHLQADPKEAG